jgi:PAS domain S-box-containing protein
VPEQKTGLHELLVENSLGLMCVHDLDGVLLALNPAAAASLGFSVEQGLGRNIREYLVPSVQGRFEEYLQRIRKNPADSGIMHLRGSDGSQRIWLYRNVRYEQPGQQAIVLGHALDITERVAAECALKQSQAELAKARDELELRVAERTAELRDANARLQTEMEERKQVEEELLRARKLEAIGNLAGGIAHDFNNLMTIVGGYCALLHAALGDNRVLQEQVSEIRKAAEQANSLTRQLLAFSRRQAIRPAVLDLNQILNGMSPMMQSLLSDNIELTILTDTVPGLICCDRGQIEQVIMNLAVNAADAMPRGGKLVLSASTINLDESHARLHLDLPCGAYVRLMVSDTGRGMDSETRARIFEPFFTTKGQARGSGLGLAIVYGVVKQANAHIAVDSEPQKGTTFKIYFPRVQEAAPDATVPRSHCEMRGCETVLLVDDQAGLRTLLSEVLRKTGYSVLTASNGRDALRLADEHHGQIDLVITDMVMPRMGGRELATALAASRPKTRILCMSGYTDRAGDISQVLAAGNAFIEKPFSTESLLVKVRELLDAPASSLGDGQVRRIG